MRTTPSATKTNERLIDSRCSVPDAQRTGRLRKSPATGLALDAGRAAVPDEEAHDQDDRADDVEPERDRAADAGAEQEPEHERHERRAGRDGDDQQHEAARRRREKRRPGRLGRHVAQDEEAAAAGGSLSGGAVVSRISSAVSGQRSSG